MSSTRYLARTGAALVVIAALGFGTSTAAYADKPADKPANQGSTNHSCDGSHHSDTGHGANTDGPTNPYHNTCDEDVASDNGNGDGAAKGRPAAGTVGNADDKNPRGQAPGPSDRNNGYECDGNQGIAKGNPAHTGCTATAAAPAAAPVAPKVAPRVSVKPTVSVAAKAMCPSGAAMTEDVNHDGVVNNADCAGAQVLGAAISRPAATATSAARPLVPASVGGVQLDKRPVTVAGLPLPLTGTQARSLFAFAAMLVAAGAVLLTMGHRTARTAA